MGSLEEHSTQYRGRQEDRDQTRKGLLAAEDLILQVKVLSNRLTNRPVLSGLEVAKQKPKDWFKFSVDKEKVYVSPSLQYNFKESPKLKKKNPT